MVQKAPSSQSSWICSASGGSTPKSSGLFEVALGSGQATFGRTSVTTYRSTWSLDIRTRTSAPMCTFHSGLKSEFTACANTYELALRPGCMPERRMYAASEGGKLSVSALVDCLTSTLMPTEGTSSCVAITLSGSGVGVGEGLAVALGSSLGASVGSADSLGASVASAVGLASATGLGVAMG